jgi:peptidoglycan/xylan/chitin deacetylase (PgdA/CDA1 family)
MPSASVSDVRARPVLRWRWLRWNLHHLALVYIVIAAAGVLVFAWSWWLPVIPGVLLAALVADGVARPQSSLFYPTISHGPRSRQRVALTFDDGPDPLVTPQVLDLLAQHGARATFFVMGKSLAAQPGLAQRMFAEGHIAGNHSWRHSRWQNFRRFHWQLRELEQGQQAIAELHGGRSPSLYRPPVGLKSPELARAVWQNGLTLVAWSLHSRDTFACDPQRIAQRVLTRIRAGDIVLLHDGHDLAGRSRPQCVAAVRLILAGLQERGLECVTVPDLLSSGGGSRPGL